MMVKLHKITQLRFSSMCAYLIHVPATNLTTLMQPNAFQLNKISRKVTLKCKHEKLTDLVTVTRRRLHILLKSDERISRQLFEYQTQAFTTLRNGHCVVLEGVMITNAASSGLLHHSFLSILIFRRVVLVFSNQQSCLYATSRRWTMPSRPLMWSNVWFCVRLSGLQLVIFILMSTVLA